jgi:hypothetical protein
LTFFLQVSYNELIFKILNAFVMSLPCCLFVAFSHSAFLLCSFQRTFVALCGRKISLTFLSRLFNL